MITLATIRLEAFPCPSGRIHCIFHSDTGPQELFMSADEWSTLSLYDRALDAAEQLIGHLKGQRDEAVVNVTRLLELHQREINRMQVQRDEARHHLDERIQWQLAAVLHLQTFRALFDTAVAMREGHEGCCTEPPCGSCFRCDFDKAVDQAKEEVRAGVDEFIAESAGFWGRFAAQMQKERDKAREELADLKSKRTAVHAAEETASS